MQVSFAQQSPTLSNHQLNSCPKVHRMPPHGGYGMNSGAIDALDLGWRLAAVTKGYGGPLLLRAYNLERRRMMIRALERSLRHLLEHVKLSEIYAHNAPLLEANTPAGENIRLQIRQFIDASGPDTMDHGIELDLRYGDSSPVIYHDGSPEHKWDVKRYIPSTRPGCRAPHVFLRDGVTSTYDLFGVGWTLVHFVSDNGNGNDNNNHTNTTNEKASEIFTTVAKDMAFPLKRVLLHNEDHAFHVWEERDLVLVRPDTHVAWRGYAPALTCADVEEILSVVAGRVAFPGFVPSTDVGSRMFEELIAGFTDMHQGSSSSSTILGEDV